jgi:undecaprenyl-diphosphatase
MSIIEILVLGFVQGITEFIPVSSSGHLVITNHLLGVGDSFTFDVLLNFGTLLALVIYYRRKIWSIIKRLFSGGEWPLVLKVVIATIPAVSAGLLFDKQIAALNQNIWVVVLTLVVVGLLMVFFGKQNSQSDNREIEKSVGWKASLKVGLAQVLALIPGTSRSGITILSGLRANLSAAKAAEFSFLIAIPVIFGASIKMLLSSEGLSFINQNPTAFIVGNAVSFVSGMIAISFLIKFISKRGLRDFGFYRIGLAGILAVLLIMGLI